VFVPVAEDSGLITLISCRVLELLALDAPAILALRPDFRFTRAVTAQVALLIIEMGKTLSLDLVAEGVEHVHQAYFHRDNGVRYAQGWFYARAMPAEGLCAELTAGAGR
jgi:sensor c-di-GMP phosphodiesterase-like protein